MSLTTRGGSHVSPRITPRMTSNRCSIDSSFGTHPLAPARSAATIWAASGTRPIMITLIGRGPQVWAAANLAARRGLSGNSASNSAMST